MQVKNCLKKAVLLAAIGLIGYMGCTGGTREASAAPVNGKVVAAEAATGQAIDAAASEEDTALYPVSVPTEKGTRYGYMNGTGEMVIQPIYMMAENFSEGFAVVYDGEKNLVINTKGKAIYKSGGIIQSFHNGLAAFYDPDKNYKYGYLNTEGKVVIKPQYNNAGNFGKDHTAIVTKSGKYYVINEAGKVQKTYQLDKKYNNYGIAEDGYVIYNDTKTFLEGVVSIDGKVILKPVYGGITYLGDGLFGVKKEPGEYEAYLIGVKPAAIFNANGKRLTDYKYYDLSNFEDGYASATDSKYTYFIDKNGKKVTSLPKVEGRGTLTVLGDIIQANVDDELFYMKKDGTIIWKNDGITELSDGVTVNTVKLRPNKYVVVSYPQIAGIGNAKVQTAINTELKSIFTKSRKNLKVKDYLFVNDSFIAKQLGDLLIINRNGYDYPVGAAHGMPLRNYYFINMKTGDFYQLKDLFKKDSKYTSVIGKIVEKQMKENSAKDNAVYFSDIKGSIGKDQYFYLDGDSLTIYYDCADITAYAAGFPEFQISFKEIKSIINTQGAFWKAFH